MLLPILLTLMAKQRPSCLNIVGDNGSGMHVHQSLAKNGVNLFTGDLYGGLSEPHCFTLAASSSTQNALNAFTQRPQPTATNVWFQVLKRPLCWLTQHATGSASIRIPFVNNPKGRRIEVRFPDLNSKPLFGVLCDG